MREVGGAARGSQPERIHWNNLFLPWDELWPGGGLAVDAKLGKIAGVSYGRKRCNGVCISPVGNFMDQLAKTRFHKALGILVVHCLASYLVILAVMVEALLRAGLDAMTLARLPFQRYRLARIAGHTESGKSGETL
jgi:hypothetical protein